MDWSLPCPHPIRTPRVSPEKGIELAVILTDGFFAKSQHCCGLCCGFFALVVRGYQSNLLKLRVHAFSVGPVAYYALPALATANRLLPALLDRNMQALAVLELR